MPASCTALTVLPAPVTPMASSFDEQQSDASPGNRFKNDGRPLLYVRNSNVSARVLTFYADIFGVERTIATVTVPGSATEHGVLILGPFPPDVFNEHSTTEVASNGYVMFTHNGADADILLCPFLKPDNPRP